jgi:23S rRNA pseudouridine1911/1915/1917 synthase
MSLLVENHWHIPHDMNGLRADSYVQRKIGRISRMRAQRIIVAKDFLLDGKPTKPSRRVRFGQKASLRRFAPDDVSSVDELLIEEVYSDGSLLVLNKPPHLAVHPSANCLFKTLTHWLKKNFAGQKIHPCHRIDKETSGLIICAKNRETDAFIKRSFMQGRVKKSYLAIVRGKLIGSRRISFPLALQGERGLVRMRMIHDESGKEAVTRIRSLYFCEKTQRSLLLVKPFTGRQHQIRAHLALIGFPLVGDKLYAYGDEFFDALSRKNLERLEELEHERHALHAFRLRFRFNNKVYKISAPWPGDFNKLIDNSPLQCVGSAQQRGTECSVAYELGRGGAHVKLVRGGQL